MKKLFLLLITMCCTLAVEAQTLNIYQGSVCVGVSAADAGDMTYDNGTTLTIAGRTYSIADIDSIVVNTRSVTAGQVEVEYSNSGARVFMAGDVAPYLTASVSGAHVSITSADGLTREINYVLSGTSSDGSFTQTGSYKMRLTLKGLGLTSLSGAAINVQNGKRIKVVLAEGTTNTLTDAAAGSQKACFYVRGHAEFVGGGTLTLTGRKAHAFASGEYTELHSSLGHISVVSAVTDGFHVGQYFRMAGGRLTIAGVKSDGIDVGATKDSTEENNGQLLISGGTLAITLDAANDVKGIKADSLITISGGNITITGSGNGQKGIKTATDLLVNNASGIAPTITITLTGTTHNKGQADESKTRGMKIDRNFTFDGGTINISTSGSKAKAIVVDGTYYYKSGTINCPVSAATVG
ncbi:carbohydrate-binding domain-containing protein [Alloprevotella rava]|uniref:Carbohydrate-binding domain-containing protein n=1 Tax=Alloprevotella rava TaxID=671218 RepID=A0A7W5UP13_9BACT|nr:carbohydrate-binding domain-containing protein [Alloprevotella rava]MBB3703512.1 hypothetical protein [Alloprevotella rava]